MSGMMGVSVGRRLGAMSFSEQLDLVKNADLYDARMKELLAVEQKAIDAEAKATAKLDELTKANDLIALRDKLDADTRALAERERRFRAVVQTKLDALNTLQETA